MVTESAADPTGWQVLSECKRIARTEHLVQMVDPFDDTYRGLTVQESRQTKK